MASLGRILLSFAITSCVVYGRTYEPNWLSIDSRPLPDWYDKGKIGIFIHWGLFSVPSFASEWFWWYWKGAKHSDCVKFMEENYPPGFTYADFAGQFTAEFFNAEQWAEIFRASGARYVVLTSKHHEGFANWPSKYSWNWNSMDVGPKRDLVGELANAIRNRTSLKFGLYHSMYEWFNPTYIEDRNNKFKTQNFVKTKTLPELYELVNKYKPEVVWSDGDWEAKDVYWNSTEFIAWLYNESPVKDTVVINDRWGKGIMCKHGGYLTCQDRYNPGVLLKRKWENAMTLDKRSWGYRRTAEVEDILSIEQLLQTVTGTVSCGGNVLINIGPTSDGVIVPIFEERLRQLGEWLNVNREAIYDTNPWKFQNDTVTPNVWYTSRTVKNVRTVYAILHEWPKHGNLYLAAPLTGNKTHVSLVGYQKPLHWKAGKNSGIYIDVAPISYSAMPCRWAWTFKMTGLIN